MRASLRCRPWEVDHPIRVGAVQLAVRVDHLRLDPQPKVHPQRVDLLDQRLQTVWEFLLIRPPVAQPGVVILAPVEPAIVHHEQLHAHLRRQLCQLDLRVLVHVEGGGFPRVVQHLVQRLAVRQHLLTDVIVQPAAGLAKSVRGIAANSRRGGEAFPRIEPPGKVPVVQPQAEPRGAELRSFRR